MKTRVALICVFAALTGNAIAQEKKKSPATLKEKFPEVIGNLMFSKNNFSLPGMFDNQTKSDTVFFYNASSSAISISVSKSKPYIKTRLSGESVKPKGKGWLAFKYVAAENGDYGFMWEGIGLTTNDPLSPEKSISFATMIVPFIPKMTAVEKAKAPKLKFEEPQFDFGDVKEGTIPKHTFKITNVGFNDLKLLAVKPECGCISAILSKNVLAKGDSAFVEASYNATGKNGPDEHGIIIYCNDPDETRAVIGLKANVIP